LKFYDDLQNTIIRDALNKLYPGRSGGSGGTEGFANLLRVSLLKTKTLARPLTSPKTAKAAIQLYGAASRAKIPTAIPEYLLKKSPTAMMNIMSSSQNPDMMNIQNQY
jgi:hypothetical protein